MMGKTVFIFFTLCLSLLCFSACSWVDDDGADCPTGCWLQLSYTYNMLDAEAVSTQVKDATLFIWDESGNFVGREDVDSLTLHRNDCMILVPSLPEGNYTFLVWAGLEDSCYQFSPSSLDLVRDEDGEQSRRLSSLFYGRLDNVYVDGEYQKFVLPLIKDTNLFNCIVQSQSDDFLSAEDFRFEIVARNSSMNHWNAPIDTVGVCYLPFMQVAADVEGLRVIQAGMNTLRLMVNDNTRLRLIYVPGGYQLFDISLTEYLLLSRQIDTVVYPPQEYLDRQDRYDLIFFLNSTDNPDKPYQCKVMRVNGWIVRLMDAELE